MKKIKVKYRKLGREVAWGIWHPSKNLIELDERPKGKKLLSHQIHEALHVAFPELTEEKILEAEKTVSDILWTAIKEKEKHEQKTTDIRGV